MANFVAVDLLPPGAVLSEDGTAVFPGTKRPDGSVRKERPIRKLPDGRWFVPQDEVDKYQTKGEVARATNKANGPVGYSPPLQQPSKKGQSNDQQSKAPKKTEAKRQAEGDGRAATVIAAASAEAVTAIPVDEKDALSKKIKGLKKKLRAVDELEAKAAAASAKLNADQAAKVAKRGELETAVAEAEAALASLSV